MRRCFAGLALAIPAFVVATGQAQSRPDFSGTWQLVSGATAGSRPAMWGALFAITQNSTSMKVETVFRTAVDQGDLPGFPGAKVVPSHGRTIYTTVSWMYQLDGSDSRNRRVTLPEGAVGPEIISKARFDGDTLAITSTQSGPTRVGPESVPMTWEAALKLSLGADGTLLVESTSRVTAPATLAGPPITTHTVYRRVG